MRLKILEADECVWVDDEGACAVWIDTAAKMIMKLDEDDEL